MRKRNIGLAAAALGATLASTGCVPDMDFGGGQGVKGSGVRKQETRQVSNFTGIDIGGASDIEVQVGPKTSLRIEADDNLLPLIVTEVKEGELRVTTKEPISSTKGTKFWITTPRLESVELSGASELELNGVRGARLTMDVSGASTVEADGEVEELSLDASGASKANLRDLKVRRANVGVSGASTAKLHVSEALTGEASGASSIRYWGGARANVERSGASSVSRG